METTPRAPARPLWRDLRGRREIWTLGALLLIWLVLALLPGSQFLQIRNVNGRLLGSLIEIFNDSAPIMLLMIGMTLVVGTKGIDLSVGSVIAISGATAAVLIRTQSVEPHVPAVTAQEAVTFAKTRNFEREAVVDERALLRDALRRSMGEVTVAAIRTEFAQRVADDEFIGMSQPPGVPGRAWTSSPSAGPTMSGSMTSS